MEQAIAAASEHGLKELTEYGVLGIVSAIGLGFMLWQSYQCSKGTKTVVDNNTKALNELKESNSTALQGVQIALVKIESKLG